MGLSSAFHGIGLPTTSVVFRDGTGAGQRRLVSQAGTCQRVASLVDAEGGQPGSASRARTGDIGDLPGKGVYE